METRHIDMTQSVELTGRRLSLKRSLGCLMALVLCLHLLSHAIVSAAPLNPQSSVLSTPTDLIVDKQTANPQFPETIEFNLEAQGFDATRATLNYRLVGNPVTSGVRTDMKTSAGKIEASATLDLTTHYIPPGTEVAYYWTLYGSNKEEVDTPAQTFKLVDERYNWQELTNSEKRVSVHWHSGNARFGETLLDTASDALDRLQRDTGASLQRPADIWVYATSEELRGALPRHVPEWVGGKAFPELALVAVAIADDELAEREAKRIIPHELSHLVLYQATRNPYNSPPAWLDEGIAVYNQETRDHWEEDAVREAAEEGRLVPLKALSGSFGADEDTALLSYAQGRSVVEFILTDSRYGPGKLARTIAAFREGVTYDEALKAGLGVTVDELDQQWRASLPYEIATERKSTDGAPSQDRQRSPSDPQRDPPLLLWLAACVMFSIMVLALIALTLAMILRRRPV